MKISKLTKIKGQKVLMIDFDGTLLDSMETHGKLAGACINKYFGMPLKEAIEKYHSTTGIPFSEQLKKIFPQEKAKNIEKRNLCVNEYDKRKIKEVYLNAGLFPDTIPFLKYAKEERMPLLISTSNSEELVIKSLKKFGLINYFLTIMGKERGSKGEHIKIIKNHFPKIIYFIGDSKSDVALSKLKVISMGRTGLKPKGLFNKKELIASGTNYTFSSLMEIFPLIKKSSP